MHPSIHPCIHASMHACTHTHIRTYVHTEIPTMAPKATRLENSLRLLQVCPACLGGSLQRGGRPLQKLCHRPAAGGEMMWWWYLVHNQLVMIPRIIWWLPFLFGDIWSIRSIHSVVTVHNSLTFSINLEVSSHGDTPSYHPSHGWPDLETWSNLGVTGDCPWLKNPPNPL